MSRFNYTGQVQTSKPKDECVAAIKDILRTQKGKLSSGEGAEIKAGFGNQILFRFLGAFLASDDMYPMVGVFTLQETDEGTTIDIRVEEDFGFGTLVGVEKKYREKVEARKNKLEEQLREKLG